jgi:lipoprotein-anchoring transpeptidase ErfK/SrfK
MLAGRRRAPDARRWRGPDGDVPGRADRGGRLVRAGWGPGVVALVAAGGLLAGMVLGSVPGARASVARALGGLPELLRPDLVRLAQPAVPGAAASGTGFPALVLPGLPEPDATAGVAPRTAAPAVPGPLPTAPATPSAAPPRAPSAAPSTAPTSAAPSGAAAPPCAPTARACVDLSANRSWLLRDGRVTYGPVPITHGRKGFRTPAGTFRVASKNRDHVSSIYDAEMPWSVFFNGGVAFHEGSLFVLSHGCIHLSSAAAETYFATLSVGDVVQVIP